MITIAKEKEEKQQPKLLRTIYPNGRQEVRDYKTGTLLFTVYGTDDLIL